MKVTPLILLTIATASLAYADDMPRDKDMDFISLTQECAPMVAPQTMAAIVKTESQFQPLAIGVNGDVKLARQPNNKAEAVATAKSLLAQGVNIDMGLGQVNSSNLVKAGLSIEDVFEPCKNLAASAAILHANYQVASRNMKNGQTALYAALSAYNTGSFTKGFKNGYVQKVVNNANAGVTSNPIVPAIASIPLSFMQSPQQQAVTLHQQAAEPAVKLRAEGARAAPKAIINVYNNNADSVMVYR